MNYINIFQHSQDLSVSVEKFFTEDHLLHIFLDNFPPGVKLTAQIASHKAELIREKILLSKNIYLFQIYRLVI